MKWLTNLLDVSTTDTEDIRLRRLLNLMLAIFVMILIIQELAMLPIQVFNLPLHPPLFDPKYQVQVDVCPPIALVLCVCILVVNRYWSGKLARALFLLFLAVSLFGNTPDDWTLATMTFALSIPRLPDPLRGEVTVAYLLFRIADTLEDATSWTSDRQVEELRKQEEVVIQNISVLSQEADRIAENLNKELKAG